ncbi:non-homologous end-joining DNA ligase [Rhizobium sp. Root1204]|uniref:non-homologous end-joining DNA ligase n=1 Tax=Rhizobium sp. Root1204 TaxID=1736428 RepID=UPI0007126421|nr:non-homologous end-joining DNA ligase [Rhizobium sp. Root1204]KQV32890.1 ATP-dependent DNA ligase [Rhizobium sp. Root1204]
MAKRPPKPIGLRAEPDLPLKSRARKARDPNQPRLPFDPMPDRIEPCLALLAAKPPKGDDWAFEIKWDGYRLAIHVEPTKVRILTRGGHDWTTRFSGLEKAARDLGATMILDGEAVVLDDQGRSDFGALQTALGGRGGKRNAGAAIFYAFDLLYYDGHDLTRMEQGERRAILESIITENDGPIRLSEEIEADGDMLLATACEHGLEGIIAKHRRRPYRSGRLGDWLKIKCVQSESFAVVGYEPSTTMPGAIGSLLLAARKGDRLVYVGSVGTGFKHSEARKLKQQLDQMPIKRPPVSIKGKNLVYARPDLVAEIEFRAWTGDGKLRHASFKGLRDDADAADIYEID